jgi:hypothetical protein
LWTISKFSWFVLSSNFFIVGYISVNLYKLDLILHLTLNLFFSFLLTTLVYCNELKRSKTSYTNQSIVYTLSLMMKCKA